MIILNDSRFSDEVFYEAKNLDDIKNSPNNSTILFKYNENDLDLYKFCQKNNIRYGVEIDSIKELIFISNLNATYATCNNLNLAKNLQKIADNYLLETKIVIKSYIKNIEEIALNEIDAIFIKKENK